MDTVRVGRQLRALRHRRGWRQLDLAARAGVSQSTVARVEAGQIDSISLRTLAALADALTVRLDVRLLGGIDLDRLLDAGHAAIVDEIVRRLRDWGWNATPEVTFSVYGERGSIDVLAWHRVARVVLVVEVKTEIGDVQITLATLDRKVRLAWRLARDRGWEPAAVAQVLVVGEHRTSRRIVSRLAATFDAALPVRGRSVIAWMRRPTPAPMRGLVFLTGIHALGRRPRKRVRIRDRRSETCSSRRRPGRANARSFA